MLAWILDTAYIGMRTLKSRVQMIRRFSDQSIYLYSSPSILTAITATTDVSKRTLSREGLGLSDVGAVMTAGCSICCIYHLHTERSRKATLATLPLYGYQSDYVTNLSDVGHTYRKAWYLVTFEYTAAERLLRLHLCIEFHLQLIRIGSNCVIQCDEGSWNFVPGLL